MRDIAITILIFGSLPLILKHPANGVLMWIWISVMNPHTQGWGFATTFPFAFIVAVTTVFSAIVSRQPKTLPLNAITFALLAFVLWMNVTTLCALFPQAAHVQWIKVMKIMLMSLMSMMLVRSRQDVRRLIWVLVLSLGYYGVKGGLLLFMPDRWSERMDTIGDYQADDSAMGRINAWHMAYQLASERFFGGGFEIAEPATFLLYAPNPTDVHAAHSIYFQVLGEHGFAGLALYLLLGGLTWRSAARTVQHSRNIPALLWAQQLATMIQASLVGFATGGAFLSLAYFDVPYYLMAVVVATRILIMQSQAGAGADAISSRDGSSNRTVSAGSRPAVPPS